MATRALRFYVEPIPSGGYFVKLKGADAPLSRHDTEEEALSRRAAYEAGAAKEATTGDNVRLRDGSQVLVRQVHGDDRPLFEAGFDRLSEGDARPRRFMAPRPASSLRDLGLFTDLDEARRAAVGALDPFTGEGLGMARYTRLEDDPEAAEAAIVVVDAWQGRGLGSILLRRLMWHAQDRGVERFCASLLTGNHAMLALFERIGTVAVTGREGQTVTVTVTLGVGDGRALYEALRIAARYEADA